MTLTRQPRHRIPSRGVVSASLVAAVVASLSIGVVRELPAGAIADGSAPGVLVVGSGGAAVLPFAGDAVGGPTATFPAPTLSLVSHGEFTLPGTFSFSFDAGATEPIAQSDVWWAIQTLPCSGSATDCTLDAENGAQLANLGDVSSDPPSPQQLPYLPYASAPIPGDVLVSGTGDVFAVHTNAGNYALVDVVGKATGPAGDSITLSWLTYAPTSGRFLSAVADSASGTQAVAVGTAGKTPTAFVMDPGTGASLGSIAFPTGEPLAAVAADPVDPAVMYVASQDALYSVNLADLTAQPVYTLPEGSSDSFDSMAVSPDGSTVYLGGVGPEACSRFVVFRSCTALVNAVFAVSTGNAPALSAWSAPAGYAGAFSGAVTDLTVTPNGQELFAANDTSFDPATAASPCSVCQGAEAAFVFGFSLPLPAQGTTPTAVVPLPVPSQPACRSITVSPDGLDVYVGADVVKSGFSVTGFPVASPSSFAHISLPVEGFAPEAQSEDDIAIAGAPDGHSLIAAMGSVVNADSGAIATALDVVSLTSSAASAPSMAAPAAPSQVLRTGWPVSPEAVAITPDQSPVVSFTSQAAPAGTASSFNATASTVQFGSVALYSWSFGDGGTSTSGPTPTHVFANPGAYTVVLCETDSAGIVDGATVTGTAFSVDGPGQTPYWSASPCLSQSITVLPASTTTATTTATTAATTSSTTTTSTTTTSTTTTSTTTTTTHPATTTLGTTTTASTTTPTTVPTTVTTATLRTTTTARVKTKPTTTTTRPPRHPGKPPRHPKKPVHHHKKPALPPVLRLNPAIGPPGTIVTITGSRFPPHKPVTISWSLSSGLVVAKTDASGNLTAILPILVPDVLGPRFAVAAGYKSDAPFLVVPGSSQPGGEDANPIFRTEGP
jgi:PKD repeat protein